MGNDRFEHIYENLNGYLQEQDEDIENCFAKGAECERLYDLSYEARERLTAALASDSKNSDGADHEDVLIIVGAYEKMGKIIAEKCYAQGYKDAKTILKRESKK